MITELNQKRVSRRILHSRKGFSLISVLVGLVLAGILSKVLMDLFDIAGKSQKGITQSAEVDELMRQATMYIRNDANCSCIFTAAHPIAAAATFPPYQFNTAALGAGLTDSNGGAVQLTVAPWNTQCTASASYVMSNNGAPGAAIPGTNSLQISNIAVTNLQPLANNYTATLNFTITKPGSPPASFGASTFNRSISIGFSTTPVAGTTVQINGCSNTANVPETQYFVSQGPGLIQITPLNQQNMAIRTLSLKLNDGVVRSVTWSALGEGAIGFAPSYRPASHGYDSGGGVLFNNATNGPWFYLYAVPRIPPHPEAGPPGSPTNNSTRLAFIASQIPPSPASGLAGGPGGAYAGIPYKYITAFRFFPLVGSLDVPVHYGGNVFHYRFPTPSLPPAAALPDHVPQKIIDLGNLRFQRGGVTAGGFVLNAPPTASHVKLTAELEVNTPVNGLHALYLGPALPGPPFPVLATPAIPLPLVWGSTEMLYNFTAGSFPGPQLRFKMDADVPLSFGLPGQIGLFAVRPVGGIGPVWRVLINARGWIDSNVQN